MKPKMSSLARRDLATFGQRLWFVTSEKGLKDTLIQELGISDKTLERYFKDVTSPTVEGVAKIADLTGMSADWFVRGIEPPTMSIPASKDEDVALIPRRSVQLSAGLGISNYDDAIDDYVPISRSMLARLGVSPEKAHIIQAAGDSMEETIADGDDVLINMADTTIKFEGIYAVQLGDLAMIKRVQPLSILDTFTLHSDNERYTPMTIKRGEVDQFRVIGRARLVMRVL